MIKVYVPNNFIPERTYAVNTLLHHYCGLEIEIVPRKGQIHYELSWEDKSIVIKDQFFGKTFVGESYLSPDRIPAKIISASAQGFENILIIYGEDKLEITQDKLISDADLFASSFFMLTRWEESVGLHEDLHGRFPAKEALIVKEGFILRPVVDEYAMLIKQWMRLLGYPLPDDASGFKIVPTCDVDIPYYWRSRPGWKILAGRFWKHRSIYSLKQDFALMKSMKKDEQKDPFDTFDYMMSLAEQKGKQILFHMIGGGESKFEGYYNIDDPHILSLMKEFIRRGHQIGLHPSYNEFNDPKKLDKERIAVEKHSGVHVKNSRQHYLRFAVPTTWSHLHNAYIKTDSTLGYAAEPGFRCGTSKPFPVFDVHQRKELPLIERPLLIMDVSLRFYKNFSIEESKEYCKTISEQVKKHNGELVFLWHNSSFSELDGWEGWEGVFEYLMDPL